MKRLTVRQREAVLQEIAAALRKRVGYNLQSAFAYGSALCEDFCDLSDFDILVVLRQADVEDLKRLQAVKRHFSRRTINVDLNVHTVDEMPQSRGRAFWHNNRELYVQEEFRLYGRVLIGDPFASSSLSKVRSRMQLEAVRVVNSLLYQCRKIIINRPPDRDECNRIMKFCIYATLYALAYYDIYPKTKVEALAVFENRFPDMRRPSQFLHVKTSNRKPTRADLEDAYFFLSKLDRRLSDHYLRRGVSH